MMKNLLIVDSLRGIDSTGIAAIDRNDDVRVVKQLGNPFELFATKTFDSAIGLMNRAIIGHNRFATQGLVTKRNAHPFDFDTLTGVHNGTLTNKHKLLDSKDYVVDSENLFHHMEVEGLKSLLGVMEGAWSLVWWDKQESTLNFLRNKERPMWISESKNGQIIMWASEPWMLDVVIGRENIDFEEPVSTLADKHYSFHIDKNAVISKPHVKDAIGIVPAPSYQGYQGHGNFHHGRPVNAGNRTAPVEYQQKPDNVSVTPTGKVITFSKKARVVPSQPKALAADSTNFYKDRKNVLLECLAELTDKHGSKYITCFDSENRAAHIRLYLRRDDVAANMVGKEILCSVGSKIADGIDGLYYKVEHGSVKLTPAEVEENNQSAGVFFADARGKLLLRSLWEEKYEKGCSWCTANVFPEEANRFTESDDIICPDCASDMEVHNYVKIR